MFTRIAVVATLAISASVIATAAHAIDIQPGLWQDTENTEVNGKKQPPKVSTDCVKPEDAKDIVKKAKADFEKSMKESGQQQQCSKLDLHENGNVIVFNMKCGDPKQGSIDMALTMTIQSPQHSVTVATTTMSIMGQKMTSSMTTDSRWIAAACKK